MTATTLLDGHNTAIGIPTRSTIYVLKLVIRWTLGGQIKRARTRSTAAPRIPSTTRTDPATQTT